MELNPEESEKLKQLREALEQEFEAHETQTSKERKSALQDLADLKADMLEALRHTLRHSQSESLRSKVAMWGYDRLLEEHKTTADPLADLLANVPTPSSPSPKSNPT